MFDRSPLTGLRSSSWAPRGTMDNYPAEAIELALSRGWSPVEHAVALLHGDDDEVALTHPINVLTEEEGERLFT